MIFGRRVCLVSIATIILVQTTSHAQLYPSRPVTIVVPLAAGTGMDVIARSYGEKLASAFGQPVVVENKPGAAFLVATRSVIAAPPDGHTLLVAAPVTLSINQSLFKQLPYDPEKDLTAISLYGITPFVLVVNPAMPAHTVAEFIAYAKRQSTPLTYSSPAGGGVPHYAVELIRQRLALQLTHVPYKNSPQSIQDVAAGHVAFAFAEAAASRALIETGKLRALAVSSRNRIPTMPAVPTFAEASGMSDFEIIAWHALAVRTGTPQAIVTRLNAEMKRIVGDPEMQQRIANTGLIPMDPPGMAETGQFIKSETVRWRSIIQTIGLAGSQ